MPEAFINRIATANPPHDVHDAFLRFGQLMLKGDNRRVALFDRMAERSGIAHRYSFLQRRPGRRSGVDTEGFYRLGDFPDTAARMRSSRPARPAWRWRRWRSCWRARTVRASPMSSSPVAPAFPRLASTWRWWNTAACRLGGAHHGGLHGLLCRDQCPEAGAAHCAFRARGARVLAVNLELCTLHLHETAEMEEILSFLLFADGCAAALVSADPKGVAMESFHAALVPDTSELIRWHIRQQGFDMVLSGAVPGRHPHGAVGVARRHIGRRQRYRIVGGASGRAHRAGRGGAGLRLAPTALGASRSVLNDYGNMSSGTVMFVLDSIMRDRRRRTTRLRHVLRARPGGRNHDVPYGGVMSCSKSHPGLLNQAEGGAYLPLNIAILSRAVTLFIAPQHSYVAVRHNGPSRNFVLSHAPSRDRLCAG